MVGDEDVGEPGGQGRDSLGRSLEYRYSVQGVCPCGLTALDAQLSQAVEWEGGAWATCSLTPETG